MFDVVRVALGSAVAQGGTIVFPFPAGACDGSYANFGHSMFAEGLQKFFSQDDGGISVAFTTEVTVTYKGATSIPANTVVMVQLNRRGSDRAGAVLPETVVPYTPYLLELGVPTTIDVDRVCAAQNRIGAGDLVINGSGAVAGKCVLDTPRCLIVDSGGADDAVITIYGYDVYGQPMAEAITANGTTAVAGKKAFKVVTRVHASKTVANGLFIGDSKILGLPVFLPADTATAVVLGDFEDTTFDTSLDGTLVAGVQTKPTATTGDVRGTYDVGFTPDGATRSALLVYLTDPTYKGVTQYAG
jgi:hypothetical protein